MSPQCEFCGSTLGPSDRVCGRCGHEAVDRSESLTATKTVVFVKRQTSTRVETGMRANPGVIQRMAEHFPRATTAQPTDFGRTSRSIPKALRFAVLERDGFRCRYCGRGYPDVVLELDHATSWKEGGETNLDNLVTSCFDCNRGKSSKSSSPEVQRPREL